MFEKTRARKGVTIAEITVALALVSIMITLIVSFVLSITERTKASLAYDAMRRDCTLIESVAEWWMNAVAAEYSEDDSSVSISYTDDVVDDKYYHKVVTVNSDYTLNFENNSFTGTIPTGENKDITIYTETVDRVELEMLNNEYNSELLLICKIYCKNYKGERHSTPYIICVNPHVGE